MNRLLAIVLVVLLGLLVWFSFRLAGDRIYQVDECTEVYVARNLATGEYRVNSPGHITLFQVLLAPVLRGPFGSADLLASGRLVMFIVFWLNLSLIAMATGERLFGSKGLFALLGAATLAPLWDYGFEIRHDNLLLTGVLLMWGLIRSCPPKLPIFVILGAITAGLQFVAFKAFVYTLPISLLALIFPRSEFKMALWKPILAWIAGLVTTILILRIAFGLVGWWGLFMAGSEFLANTSSGGRRFGPGLTLARLLGQTPFLLALVMAGLGFVACDLWRRRRVALKWEGDLPEALLLLVAFGALVINPAPFPYNLLFLVPFAFIFAFRFGVTLLGYLNAQRNFPALPVVVGLLVFTHFVPFWLATRRHLEMVNFRQEALMRLAENLTTPAKDRIYDGISMVVARPVDLRWFIHSFNVESLTKGAGLRVWEMLAAQPPAVFIPNYRTDWLTEEDHKFIEDHYVPLADDFWVLGTKLPPGGGTFEIIHPGRYQIRAKEASCILGTVEYNSMGLVVPPVKTNCVGTLDGQPLPTKAVELTVGTHRIETTPDCEPTVVWLGPKLDQLRPVVDRDHRWLFVNWY